MALILYEALSYVFMIKHIETVPVASCQMFESMVIFANLKSWRKGISPKL